MKRIAQLGAVVLLLACAAFGQQTASESQDFMVAANAAACTGSLQTPPVNYANCKPLVAGTVTLTHSDQRNVFSTAHTLELNWTGTAAATATITVKGCMRGLTCTATALATGTSVANAILSAPATTPYDQLQITVAWTGGDATTFLTIRLTGALFPPQAGNVAGSPGFVIFPNVAGTDDPCANPHIIPTPVLVNGLAANTQIVALTANQVVYVCGYFFTLTGTAPTVQFVGGTGATCGTGTTNLTGVLLPLTGSFIAAGNAGRAILVDGNGAALCLFITGTTPVVAGNVSIIKQ